ncbi:MAG: DUF3883 domain-containing protein [Desulfobacteraceae bacterium]|nr:DUF3883 domain-containing protein [Desulfobacteraceae bacterium]
MKKSRLLKINYLEKEAANIAQGSAGEKFVLKYERTRLESIEKFNLADRIEQVSETKGDWTGYDIRSFDDNGNDSFITVKTTRYGIDTPFFVTKNELGFSTVGHHKDSTINFFYHGSVSFKYFIFTQCPIINIIKDLGLKSNLRYRIFYTKFMDWFLRLGSIQAVFEIDHYLLSLGSKG